MNFTENTIINEPLYPFVKPYPWEMELFQSNPVRRLKQLAHFGAGSLVSPVVHSRYEHTVGVWKLVSIFFPNDMLLRAAAILHDVGHLPFSHSVEKTLGFNHHHQTEKIINEEEISSILQRAGISPFGIIDLLNTSTVITGKENIVGIDHLDSFFRDTYMAGEIEYLPKNVLSKMTCTSKGIETDQATGLYLLKLIQKDHELFLSPFMVAVDRLLAEAVRFHWNESSDRTKKSEFVRLTDSDVIAMLKSSQSTGAKKIIHTLLYEPSKIKVSEKQGSGYPISIRKLYNREPLYKGEPITQQSEEARRIIQSLSYFGFDLEVFIS